MNNLGTFVALAEGGRLFGLDLQLLLDAAITAVNVFILFILLSYCSDTHGFRALLLFLPPWRELR